MSHRSLHLATRDRLRMAKPQGMGFTPGVCDVMPNGSPPNMAGELFVAVHRGPRRNIATGPAAAYMEDEYTFYVTVTVRAPVVPKDRRGTELLDRIKTGLEDQVDLIRELLFRYRYKVMDAANALIPGFGVSVTGFKEPAVPVSDDVQEVYNDWFGVGSSGQYAASGSTDEISGYACRIEMAGAKRLEDVT